MERQLDSSRYAEDANSKVLILADMHVCYGRNPEVKSNSAHWIHFSFSSIKKRIHGRCQISRMQDVKVRGQIETSCPCPHLEPEDSPKRRRKDLFSPELCRVRDQTMHQKEVLSMHAR